MMLVDILMDTLIDAGKLLPFLFLTYLVMELLEHHAGIGLIDKIAKVDKAGPLWGAAFGIVPQCGFSAAASSLFAGRVITLGTLMAIYLSTSDEMLPILLSEAVPLVTIIKIIASKFAIAMISGFLVELVMYVLLHKHADKMDIHVVCEKEKCHCEDGAFLSAVKHTLRILCYILILSLILNFLIAVVGEDTLGQMMTAVPVVGQVMAALIGLIPNCASSVVITSLYVEGMLTVGMMMAGLLVNAGVGLLVLFRLNRNPKQNLMIVGILYLFGVLWGILIDLAGIVF